MVGASLFTFYGNSGCSMFAELTWDAKPVILSAAKDLVVVFVAETALRSLQREVESRIPVWIIEPPPLILVH